MERLCGPGGDSEVCPSADSLRKGSAGAAWAWVCLQQQLALLIIIILVLEQSPGAGVGFSCSCPPRRRPCTDPGAAPSSSPFLVVYNYSFQIKIN